MSKKVTQQIDRVSKIDITLIIRICAVHTGRLISMPKKISSQANSI
jgi:hypothetical protein